jgi:hypothetical protein
VELDFQREYGAAVVGEVSVVQLCIVACRAAVVVGWEEPPGDCGYVRLASSGE